VSFESVGRRYAQAIFEIAKESGTLTQAARELTDFGDTYRSSLELRDALDNPLVPEEAREAMLLEIAQRTGAGETTQRALRVIFRARRLRGVHEIAARLARLVDEDQKVLRASVTSAQPLADSYLARLRTQLEQATGSKVVLDATVDPSLIAGVVTQIGDRVVDGSLKSRLEGFARAAQADRIA
jgi:F-type H+-transporting ATPase subunit delta